MICSTAKALPEKSLNTVFKGNSVCIFTNDKRGQPYEGRIYVYIGEVNLMCAEKTGGFNLVN